MRRFSIALMLVLVLAESLAIARDPCWPEPGFLPREIDVVHGNQARPAEGEPFGYVFGSLGSAGSDAHLYSRGLGVRLEQTNPGAVWGGGARAIYMTTPIGKFFKARTDVTCQVEKEGSTMARLAGFFFRLKPGEYELYSLGIERRFQNGPLVFAPQPSINDTLVGLRFTVKADSAVYLGEFLSATESIGGKDYVVFQLRDHMERDKYIAAVRDVHIRDVPVFNLVPEVARALPDTIRLRQAVATSLPPPLTPASANAP